VDQILLIEKLFNLINELQETSGVPAEERIKDKNVLGTSDPNKKVKPVLNSSEIRRVTHIATLFAETFFKYKKKITPDKKPETLIKKTQQKLQPPPPTQKKESKSGLMTFAGLFALVGGVGALLYGLLQGGPLMGIMKILSKIGISGGLKLIMRGIKPFLKSITRILKLPLQIFARIGNAFKGIGSSIGKVFKNVGSKMLGKGVIAKMATRLGGFLLKALRRIPILSTIISFGFAISRFNDNDHIAGVIDVLSGLSGLLYLFTPTIPLAFGLGLGLDVLNAWLDVKTAKSEDKNAAKLDILKDMGKRLTDWLLPKLRWLPVIGSIFELGDAYTAFKDGNVMEGLKYVVRGLGSLVGVTQIYDGLNLLTDMFSKKDEKSKEPKSSGISWVDKLKKWIKGKLKSLPYVLRKPLEWMGILDDSKDDVKAPNQKDAGKKLAETSAKIWEGTSEVGKQVADKVKKGFGSVGKFFGDSWNKLKDKGYQVAKNVDENLPFAVRKAKEWMAKTQGNIAENAQKNISDIQKSYDNAKKQGSSVIEKTASTVDRIQQIGRMHFKYMQIFHTQLTQINKSLMIIAKNPTSGTNVYNSTEQPYREMPTPSMANFGDNRAGYLGSDYSFA
jgi:hypothetical protein